MNYKPFFPGEVLKAGDKRYLVASNGEDLYEIVPTTTRIEDLFEEEPVSLGYHISFRYEL